MYNKIVITECQSIVLKLTGGWPLFENAKLTFTPEIGDGDGRYRISISTNSGSSWTEIYDNTDLDNEEPNGLWLTGSRGYITIWVKIECDQDISVELDNLEVYTQRYVPEADIPVIDIGDTRKVKISDSNDTIASVSATWRNRFRG